MKLLKSGDADLFKEIYTAHFPLLYNYAHTITKDKAVAEVWLAILL